MVLANANGEIFLQSIEEKRERDRQTKYYKPFIFAFYHMKVHTSHWIGDWEIIRPEGLKMIWKKMLKHNNFSRDKVFRLFFAMYLFSVAIFFNCISYCLMTMMVLPTTWWLFVFWAMMMDLRRYVQLYIEHCVKYLMHIPFMLVTWYVLYVYVFVQNTDYNPFSHFNARHKAKDHWNIGTKRLGISNQCITNISWNANAKMYMRYIHIKIILLVRHVWAVAKIYW